MKLTPAQIQVVRSNKRFRVLNAGRRFGKTVLSVEEMIGCATAKKDRSIAYIAPTYQQARDIAWEMLKKRAQPIASKINESRLEIEIMTQDGGTSKIYLRGWESVEGLRGQKFNFLVIDEVAMMRNFWIGWQEVLRPALTDTKGHVLFISTPKGFNHFYDLFNTEDESYESFKFTTYDNPHIPVEEIDEAKRELPTDKFFQEYMADFRKMEGLVYKEFDRSVHVVDETPELATLTFAGQDFGYTNPYAQVIIRRDKDNRYFVEDEDYQTQKTNQEIIALDKMMSQKYGISYWYPDPAEPDRIAEMRQAGLNCRPVSKDVLAGIDHIRELLKANRLFIHKRCKNLINEFETYRFKDDKPDKNAPEEPVKEHDHALDALRYALYAEKKIERGAVKQIKKPIYTY